jgi:hypothetical protein
MVNRRNQDPDFDADAIENEDPLGEQMFAETGFVDGPGGGPDFDASGVAEDEVDKRPGRLPQKMAGIPEERQHEVNTPSTDRPDSQGVVFRERGGESKGDPAVGGTRERNEI